MDFNIMQPSMLWSMINMNTVSCFTMKNICLALSEI